MGRFLPLLTGSLLSCCEAATLRSASRPGRGLPWRSRSTGRSPDCKSKDRLRSICTRYGSVGIDPIDVAGAEAREALSHRQELQDLTGASVSVPCSRDLVARLLPNRWWQFALIAIMVYAVLPAVSGLATREAAHLGVVIRPVVDLGA
jgi:hypothetical protein